MNASLVTGIGMIIFVGAAVCVRTGVDLGWSLTQPAPLGGNAAVAADAFPAPLVPVMTQGQQTSERRAPSGEITDPLVDIARATDITLIWKALAAQDTTTSPHLIKQALENALMDRRTDLPTAFSVAELLSASADNVGYLEWVVHALSSNLVHRQGESDPIAASEAAYGTVIEKLLSQRRFDLAMHLSDQSLRALVQNEELLAARARIFSAIDDHGAAVAVLHTIARPSDNVQAQLAQHLYRTGDLVGAAVIAKRIQTSAPELASALDHIEAMKP